MIINIFIIITGLLQGLAFYLFGVKGALFIIGIGFIYFMIRWPYLALIAGLFILLDGLGLINSETFFHIPGVFKLKDLFFISLFIPLFLNDNFRNRFFILFSKYQYLIISILCILILCSIQMIRTWVQYGLPLNSCIMAGRHYWYYALMPLTAVYLDTEQKRTIFYNLFIFIILISVIIFICQVIFMKMGGGLYIASNIQFKEAHWGNFQFMRIYMPTTDCFMMGFSLAVWGYHYTRTMSGKINYAVIMLICAVAILFINSRAGWIQAILIVSPLLFLNKELTRINFLPIFYKGLPILLALFLTVAFFSKDMRILGALEKRAVSTWNDINKSEGTWGYRLEDNQFRLNLFQKHPLFGVGFIHLDFAPRFGAYGVSDDDSQATQGISTTDSGIVALLVDFGIVGILWVIWYFISVMRLCVTKYRLYDIQIVLIASIAIMAYMISGLLTFITLGLFTSSTCIIMQSYMIGFLASEI